MKTKLQYKIILAATLLVLGTGAYAQQNKGEGVAGSPVFEGTPTQLSGTKPSSNINADLLNLESKANGSQKRAFKTIEGLPELPVNPNIQTFDKDSRVLVDISAKGDVNTLRSELESKGAEITGVYGRVISAIIPVSKISEFGGLAGLQNIAPAYKPVTNVGRVTSQGDKAQRSDIARATYGVDGLGIRVGVLSDSYNAQGGVAAGIASNDLPSDVIVLRDIASGATDEGRAMMEIIYDVAPKAKGAFASAFFGQAAFANDIIRLNTVAGCPIIVDDVFYFAEPMFSDGIIAQAVDYVKNVKGVSYFSAAGNQGKASYDYQYNPSTFSPLGVGNGTAHNFSKPGDAARYYQPIFIPRGGDFLATFQWDDPFFSASGVGAKTDMDIYLLNAAGAVVAYSFNDNIASGDPSEVISFVNPTSATSETYFVVIVKYAGPNPTRLKYVNLGFSAFYNVLNPYLPGQLASTLFGHANASGAIAVAAARYDATPAFGVNPAITESFSSEGGIPILFNVDGTRKGGQEVRVQPSITAPQGASTTFFSGGDYEGDGFPNFFGTSASAPHAAGVAALMFDAAKKSLTPKEVKNALQGTAQDMDDRWKPGFQAGWDLNSGYGLLRADLAVNAVKHTAWWVNSLAISAGCSGSSDLRKWILNNPNNFNIRVSYVQKGNGETSGELLLTPGSNEVLLAYLPTSNSENSLTVSWKDQNGVWKYAMTSAGVCTPARLADAGKSDMEVVHSFPNPATERFNIAVSNADAAQLKVTLYNAQGKVVAKPKYEFGQNVVSMEVGDLAGGIYFVKVSQGSQTKTVKMMKQ